MTNVIINLMSNSFYAILCVKFVREVRYFTSKVAKFSLSALVVRKVTGRSNNRVAMRKVPGDARRAARGRRKSGEETGWGGESHQWRSSSISFDKLNKRSSKHWNKFVFLTIIGFFFYARYFDVPIIHRVAPR